MLELEASQRHFSLTPVCRLAVGPSQLSNALRTAGSLPGGKAAVTRRRDQLLLSSTWEVAQGAVDLHLCTRVHCMAITHKDNFKLYFQQLYIYCF